MFRLLLITKLCDVVCVTFDLCVVVTKSCALSPSSHLWFSPHSCFLLALQLYHVIWMNLHRDSPIWRRRVFRKCLKETQQQQAEFLSMETPLGQTRFKCGSVLSA